MCYQMLFEFGGKAATEYGEGILFGHVRYMIMETLELLDVLVGATIALTYFMNLFPCRICCGDRLESRSQC